MGLLINVSDYLPNIFMIFFSGIPGTLPEGPLDEFLDEALEEFIKKFKKFHFV